MFKFTNAVRYAKELLNDFGLPITEQMIDSMTEAPESTVNELLNFYSPPLIGV